MIRFFLFLSLMVLPGCFNLAREEPPLQHFVLGGHGIRGGDQASGGMPGGNQARGLAADGVAVDQLQSVRIGLRHLQMAEYLDSPLIVVRAGQHQIRYSEFNRWGGSLESGVMRALESHLTALAPFEGVTTAPWDPRVRHDYLIQVHLLSMEGVVPTDQIGAEGAARMLASWEIINPMNGVVLVHGRTDYETSGWTEGDYEDLVQRLDAGLWELSRDLVAAVASQKALHREE